MLSLLKDDSRSHKKHHVGVDVMCYQEAARKEVLEEIKQNRKIPWINMLLKSDDIAPQSSKEKSEMRCVLTMKEALIVEIARPNLAPGLALLATIFRASTL